MSSSVGKIPFVFPKTCQESLTQSAPCSDLVPGLSDDALIQIFSYLNPHREMGALLCVCHGMRDLIAESCKEQLDKKESLHMKDLTAYHRRLSAEAGDWRSIFSYCKELKTFDFDGTFRKQVPRNEENEQENQIARILTSAKEYCSELKNLDFSGCFAVGDKTLSYLSDKFSQLTSLNLMLCKYSIDGIKFLTLDCKNLTSINLCDNSINDEAVICIANNCIGLIELNLYSSTNGMNGSVTDASIVVLAKQCTSLMRLNIPISDITDASLHALGENCKSLILFTHPYFLVRCTKEGMDALAVQLPYLVFKKILWDFNTFLPD
jgi:hypothetical protein